MRSVASNYSSGGSNRSDEAHSSRAYSNQMYTEVGFYKGNVVAIKRIQADEITLGRKDLLELKAVNMFIKIQINLNYYTLVLEILVLRYCYNETPLQLLIFTWQNNLSFIFHHYQTR